MKNLILLFLLAFCGLSYGQTPTKGSGILYFASKSNMDAFTPGTTASERAFVQDSETMWIYSRDSSEWLKDNSIQPNQFLYRDANLASTVISNNLNNNTGKYDEIFTVVHCTDSASANPRLTLPFPTSLYYGKVVKVLFIKDTLSGFSPELFQSGSTLWENGDVSSTIEFSETQYVECRVFCPSEACFWGVDRSGGGGGAAVDVGVKQVAYGDGTGGIKGDSALIWDETNERLGLGVYSPSYHIDANTVMATPSTGLGNLPNYYFKTNISPLVPIPLHADAQNAFHIFNEIPSTATNSTSTVRGLFVQTFNNSPNGIPSGSGLQGFVSETKNNTATSVANLQGGFIGAWSNISGATTSTQYGLSLLCNDVLGSTITNQQYGLNLTMSNPGSKVNRRGVSIAATGLAGTSTDYGIFVSGFNTALQISQGGINQTDTYSAGSAALAGSALLTNTTWNTTGVPTAWKLNVTNTASGTGSLLMDLQIGASSRFKVDKLGAFTSVIDGGISQIKNIGNENYIVFDDTDYSMFFGKTGIVRGIYTEAQTGFVGDSTELLINVDGESVFEDKRHSSNVAGLQYFANGYVTTPTSLTDKQYVDSLSLVKNGIYSGSDTIPDGTVATMRPVTGADANFNINFPNGKNAIGLIRYNGGSNDISIGDETEVGSSLSLVGENDLYIKSKQIYVRDTDNSLPGKIRISEAENNGFSEVALTVAADIGPSSFTQTLQSKDGTVALLSDVNTFQVFERSDNTVCNITASKNLIVYDATGGNLIPTFTAPSSSLNGFEIEVFRNDVSGNTVTMTPASGNFYTYTTPAADFLVSTGTNYRFRCAEIGSTYYWVRVQ